MSPKCSRKERRRRFSNHSSVEAAMTGTRCVFLCESKSTLFGLPMHLGIIKITYNRTATCFMDEFCEPTVLSVNEYTPFEK